MSKENNNQKSEALKYDVDVKVLNSTEEFDNLMKQLESVENDNIVRRRLSEGMEFTVSGIAVNKFTNNDGDEVQLVRITTSNGCQINVTHFATLKAEDVKGITIGVKKAEVARFVAFHKQEGTKFKIKEYSPRKSTYGEADYRPEEVTIIVMK